MVRVRFASVLLLPAVLAVLAACGKDPVAPQVNECVSNPRTPGPEHPDSVTYDPSLNVDLGLMTQLPSGVYYRDLTVGTGGGLMTGDTVAVSYAGHLTNGCTFGTGQFTYMAPGTLFTGGKLIQGWQDGTVGQLEGATRQIVIPPSEGYGAISNGPIPASSVLIFEIEIISIN